MFAAFKNIFRVSLAALLFAPVFTIAPAPAEAQTRCGAAVTVPPGDTLARIARRCGTSVGALVNANPQIRNPNVIYVGMTVRFPLSLRLVEEMLLERGIVVPHETFRRWGKKFGPDYARRLRRKMEFVFV